MEWLSDVWIWWGWGRGRLGCHSTTPHGPAKLTASSRVYSHTSLIPLHIVLIRRIKWGLDTNGMTQWYLDMMRTRSKRQTWLPLHHPSWSSQTHSFLHSLQSHITSPSSYGTDQDDEQRDESGEMRVVWAGVWLILSEMTDIKREMIAQTWEWCELVCDWYWERERWLMLRERWECRHENGVRWCVTDLEREIYESADMRVLCNCPCIQ